MRIQVSIFKKDSEKNYSNEKDVLDYNYSYLELTPSEKKFILKHLEVDIPKCISKGRKDCRQAEEHNKKLKREDTK